MGLIYLHVLIFLSLINMWTIDCQENKLNEWVHANNCLPNSPIVLDYCSCQCSAVSAALRTMPELQLEISRRMKLRRRSATAEKTITPDKNNTRDDNNEILIDDNKSGDAVQRANEDPDAGTKSDLRQKKEKKDKNAYTVENLTPGVLKCWETCMDSIL